MIVSEAVRTRRSVRAFLDKPVAREVLGRVLSQAQRAPSGGNTQPWHGIVLTGEPMRRLFDRVAEEFPRGREAYAPEYHIYPPELDGAYEQRRFGVGEDLYGALQISREEKGKRLMWFAQNFRAFGAPVLMLVHTPRYMGPPQWSDVGMWLQMIMLLCREEGLDTCAQEAWGGVFAANPRGGGDPGGPHLLLRPCHRLPRPGAAPVNNFAVQRAPLEEAVRWEGW